MNGRARTALGVGGAVVLIGAVVVLRGGTADELDAVLGSASGNPVLVSEFAAEGVNLPDYGDAPEPPSRLEIHSDRGRLRVAWGSAIPGGRDPARATGYLVRWGPPGQPQTERLVAGPEVELTGLATGTSYRVEVRSIDAVGRRSLPTVERAGVAPAEAGWQRRYRFVDAFDAGDQPHPNAARWRLASNSTPCLRTEPGTGADAGRAILRLDCGSSIHTLIPTRPLRLAPSRRPAGELGRVAVVTDAAGSGGGLSIDLVPGSIDFVGNELRDTGPAEPGNTPVDPTLPPGTVRVLITEDGVAVRTGPGVPRVGTLPGQRPRPARQAFGVTHRWELVLRTDGMLVLRDEVPVAASDLTAPWSEANVLIGVAAPPGGSSRIGVDAVGLTGDARPVPQTTTRDVVAPARLTLPPAGLAGPPVPVPDGANTAQLRVLLRPESDEPIGPITAVLGDTRLPVRAAIPGTAVRPDALYGLVADLPAELLDAPSLPPIALRAEAATLTPVVASSVVFGYPRGTVVDTAVAQPTGPYEVSARPAGVVVDALDPAGEPVQPGGTLPRGRLVIDVRLDGADGQRRGGRLAGLAGIELHLDGERIAAVPTARDGPAVGGRHRFVVNVAGRDPGSHMLVATAIPQDPRVRVRQSEVIVRLR